MALTACRGEALSKAETAELASRIEIERMGMPIGQDQYAAVLSAPPLVQAY